MSGVRNGDALRFLERFAPPELAEPWDRSGLQVGDPAATVTRILITLDPTKKAVEEALRQGAGLIVTHHPLLLKPLDSLDLTRPAAAIAAMLLKNGITLYSSHTNLDRAEGGVNDVLAQKLGLAGVGPLSGGEPSFKVVVTVPAGYEDAVMDAMTKAGAGRIGRYEGCAFVCRGTGHFTPGAGASPFLGKPGVRERADELRIETVAGQSALSAVIAAAARAHPYEEPVIDAYPLKGLSASGSLGRLGTLDKPIKLAEFASFVRERLDAPGVRFTGAGGAPVQSVAVCGGSGASLWREARKKGADVLVTGDVKYHDALDAMSEGFSLVDAGHGPSENAALEVLEARLNEFGRTVSGGLDVSVYRQDDPFVYV